MNGEQLEKVINQHELVDEERQKKEALWKEKLEGVEKITDRLDLGVDQGIKESVATFLTYEFTTSASCEGHLAEEGEKQHGHQYPWIEIYSPEPKGRPEADGEEKERLNQEWKLRNFEQQKKMMGLLEEFYIGRETAFDARLVFDTIGAFGGFRVQSFGAEMVEMIPKEEQKKKLDLYRKEMQDFTAFLKEKYFSGK